MKITFGAVHNGGLSKDVKARGIHRDEYKRKCTRAGKQGQTLSQTDTSDTGSDSPASAMVPGQCRHCTPDGCYRTLWLNDISPASGVA